MQISKPKIKIYEQKIIGKYKKNGLTSVTKRATEA